MIPDLLCGFTFKFHIENGVMLGLELLVLFPILHQFESFTTFGSNVRFTLNRLIHSPNFYRLCQVFLNKVKQ